MHVVIISNIYAPYDRGGAEQVVKKSIEELQKKGMKVSLITGTPGKPEVVEEDGTTIYRIAPKNLFFYTNAEKHSFPVRALWHIINMFQWKTAAQIETMLEKLQPDVVHTHNLMGLSFLIPKIIRKHGYTHVHTIHDVQLVEPSGMILKVQEHSLRYTSIFTKVYTFCTKKLFGSPNVVISPSQFLNQFYLSRGFFPKSHTVVLRNPIPFSEKPKTKNLKQSNTIRLLYVGQIERHKGVHTLVEAVMASPRQDLSLHIVGSGSILDELKTVAANDTRITFYGRLSRKDVAAQFASATMTVVPSLCYENSPTVIFESFYFHVPVLATRIEGIAELIHEGKNGLTWPAGDNRALLALISKLSIQDIKRMNKHAYSVIEDMEAHPYIEELLKLYRL